MNTAMFFKARISFAVVLCFALVAGACSGGDGSDDTTTTTTPTTTEAAAATTSTTVATTTAPTSSTTTTTTPRATSSTTTTTTTPRATSSTTSTTRSGSGSSGTNRPPSVTIASPGSGNRFEAFYNNATGRFGASVSLSARVSDPDGDSYTVEWFSSDDGFLGRGTSISAMLHPVLDTAQPTITVRVTDASGAVTERTVNVIVWIRSDE